MGIQSMKVAAVQLKFASSVAANLESILAAIRRAGSEGVDAVLFPECALTGYNRDFSKLPPAEVDAGLKEIGKAARGANTNILVGSPTCSGAKRFNSLVVFNRRGREVFRYSKIHLTPRDREAFEPGNRLAFFRLDGVACTAIICHERRFPELVRLPVMMGARIVFHPNAGLDALVVSKSKRGGRDGVVARAFENQVFYVFANSVGPQGDDLWSAGDSKIVAPDLRVLALADNRNPAWIQADLELAQAGRRYAREALEEPAFLRGPWRAMLAACRAQLRQPVRAPR